MSNLAAYLRYFGVLFLGKGHLRAQVPSKASVSSATIKIIKAFSAGQPTKANTNNIHPKIKRAEVSKSARYLMSLLYHEKFAW